MVSLMIVYRSSMTGDLEEVMRESGISAYTLIDNATGKGETGNVVGSFFYPGKNSVIFAVLPDDQVDRTIATLRSFHAERLKQSQGRPIPFKLFSFPCRELI
ncbi:MAG: PG0541 family transporter-associated protein [Nitrospira sp.]